MVKVTTFRHSRTTTCLGLLVFALLASSARAADNCVAPPGTSGIDQYCEALPNAGGTGGSNHHGGGGGGTKSHPLSSATTKVLQHQGAAGAGVLALSQSSPAPPASPAQGRGTKSTGSARGTSHHRSGGHPRQGTGTPQQAVSAKPASAPASNPAAAVGKSISGSALGGGFIALLAAIGVVLAALAWAGRRRGPGSEAA